MESFKGNFIVIALYELYVSVFSALRCVSSGECYQVNKYLFFRKDGWGGVEAMGTFFGGVN